MPARTLTILVTGFGPFPGAPANPSAAIVEALGGAATLRLARLGARLERRILPVTFDGAADRLADLMREVRPDAVLHVGLAGRRKKLGVEIRGRNRLTALFPDAARTLPASRHVEHGAPEFRRARLPVPQVTQALLRAGAPAEPSRDAGAYVCNQTLYLTLGEAVRMAGFIHIPRPRGRRPLARAKTRRIVLGDMIRGIEETLVLIAREARRVQ